MKKLLQKIKNLFRSKKERQLRNYIDSIERDERGRWVFSKNETIAELPEELLGNRDWIEFKRVVGDEKTWEVPCTCGNVKGKCVC